MTSPRGTHPAAREPRAFGSLGLSAVVHAVVLGALFGVGLHSSAPAPERTLVVAAPSRADLVEPAVPSDLTREERERLEPLPTGGPTDFAESWVSAPELQEPAWEDEPLEEVPVSEWSDERLAANGRFLVRPLDPDVIAISPGVAPPPVDVPELRPELEAEQPEPRDRLAESDAAPEESASEVPDSTDDLDEGVTAEPSEDVTTEGEVDPGDERTAKEQVEPDDGGTTGADEPLPAPARLEGRDPEYPAVSQRLREEGDATLRLELDAEGRVILVKLESSSGHRRLDQAAMSAAPLWRFDVTGLTEAARARGFLHTVHFRLRR
ncbi:MAG: TonB family protein [Planctomycetota bacterium]|nr:TonB family protein [Planctomycetota bacterium]